MKVYKNKKKHFCKKNKKSYNPILKQTSSSQNGIFTNTNKLDFLKVIFFIYSK